MRNSQGSRALVWIVSAAGFALSATTTESAITKVLDRKFPVFKFCPAESRAAAGGDLSFVAPATVVSITFSGNNQTLANLWNGFRVDNVSVVAKSVFDANLLVSPGFADCYNTATPPGQATGGVANAPAYDFNASGTTELTLDHFTADVAGWTGQKLYFDSSVKAPTIPATGLGVTGGSLGLGLAADGQVAVTASRTISGLTPGQEYVVSFWWYAREPSPITLTISSACADLDGDGLVVCGTCDLVVGQTCGDCNDSNPRCGSDCTDQDADGWCVTTDCNDSAATCTNNCAADADTDAIPDCRDGCLDADLDGFGSAGGAANTCLGPDCNDSNPRCGSDCTDQDTDGWCVTNDCDDSAATCTNNCVADADTDAIPDCRDGCLDVDLDGFGTPGGAANTCLGSDCNPSNPQCGSDCTDQDADGWCVTTDCDDGAAPCTDNCAADIDADAISDCRDGCLDEDLDGYGSASGGANTCIGPDCNPANQWCNVSCVDADADGHCAPGDCQDGNPRVANEIPEVNDAIDQNCPGEKGYGVIDEVSGDSGFAAPGGGTPFSWPSQAAALMYTAQRSSSATFLPTCSAFTTSLNSWTDAVDPPPGGGFFYLVRALTTIRGSWGQGSNGVERAVVCGSESDCGNGVDDDLDAVADCADTDCNNTPQCRVRTFSFVDTLGDDISVEAFRTFLLGGQINPSHFIFFEIARSSGRTVAWCSERANSYRSQYLGSAATQGSFMSGTWNKWRKAPETGDVWEGPSTTAQLNTYGNDCLGPHSWCSEQFSTEPQNTLLPDVTYDCEAYDQAIGACGASTGDTWQLTIRIGVTRELACGF